MAAFEIGCPYWVYAPDGVHYISFNNPLEVNFAGYVTDVTGLDDADIREAADLIPSGHGGRHHKFFVGRRPWTLAGIIMPTTPAAARATSTDNIEGIMAQCVPTDGTLQWAPSDGIVRYLKFRKQLSVRITKGQGQVDRRFLIAGVCDSPVILSGSQKSASASGVAPSIASCTNSGTADAQPFITVAGPITNPVVRNVSTGKSIEVDLAVAAGSVLHIDLTAKYPNIDLNGASSYNGSVNLVTSDWSMAVAPNRYGYANNFTLTGSGTTVATSLTVAWTDSWA